MTKLGPDARQLVDAGRGALGPSVDDKTRVLAALRARLESGAPSEAGAGARVRPSAPARKAGLGKLSALAVGAVVVGAFGVHRLRSGDASVAHVPVAAPAASADSAVDSAAAAASSSPAPLGAPDALAPDSPAGSSAVPAPEASAPRHASDRLGEEVSILSRAEAALHAGRFTSALRLLDEHQRRFPNGKLAQERTAAKIQALCALGRTSDADAELARLSPDSVHERRARAACSKPATSKSGE